MKKEGDSTEQVLESLHQKYSKRKLWVNISLISALVIVVIGFFVILFLYFYSPEKVIGLGADIEDILLNKEEGIAYIKLKAGSLLNVSKVKFSFNSEDDAHVYETSEGVDELAIPYEKGFFDWLLGRQLNGTYDYSINLADISGLESFEDLEKIEVVFEYKTETGQVIDSPVLDTQTISTPIVSGGGGGGGDTTPSCTTGSWTDTNEYRCSNLTREIRQTRTICGSEASEQWAVNLCNTGYICYQDTGAPTDLCINETQSCIDSDGLDYDINGSVNHTGIIYSDICVDSVNVTEYYCYYNNITNETEVKTGIYNCSFGCLFGKCLGPACTINSDCDDSNSCTDDVCTASLTCQNIDNDANSCNQELLCTENDVCSFGSCIADDVNVDDSISCTIDDCDEISGVTHIGDEGLCDDANICTDNTCNILTGCEFPFNTASCDDLVDCTDNDVCGLGSCSGIPNDNNCESWEYCDSVNDCTQSDCSDCEDCDDWWLFGDCHYDECHSSCNVLNECYFVGEIAGSENCVDLSYACNNLVSVCDDYSQEECNNNACNVGNCSWDGLSCVDLLAPICGNNINETGEVCDGSDIGIEDCVSQGYASGTLGCLLDCSGFNVSNCVAQPTCLDGIQNQDETDIDCGGIICSGCDLGESCLIDNDCLSGNCSSGNCVVSAVNIYYLDAINGNDSNTGANYAPWKTLERAMPDWSGVGVKVLPGDLVELRNGTYGSLIKGLGPSDVSSNWIIYKAANGATPKIQSIRFGANGAQYFGVNHVGTYDVYMRFIGIRILNGVRMYGPQHVAFENCLIERIGPWDGSVENIEKAAVGMRGGKDITIKDCEITRTGTGISARGHDVKIINNHIYNITHDGIRSIGLWDSLVQGNLIHGLYDGVVDSDGFAWDRHCDGIHIFIQGSPDPNALTTNHNITFRGNVIYDIESQGVQFNNYYAFPEVRNNNITFENNIFGPTGANVFNNAEPVDGLIFRHNSFIHFPGGRQYVSQFGTVWVNNHNLRISGSSTDVQVYNNILFSYAGLGDWNIIQSPVPDIAYSRFTIIDTNPQVENPDAFDGKLLPTSQAIDAGTRIFAPTPIHGFDREGTPRDDRPDMGAYEVPGQYPVPEEPPQGYPGTKTIFLDDFEDADFGVDPWLEGDGQQGLSWYHPIAGSRRYNIQGDDAFPDPNNILTGSMHNESSWLLSGQGSNWSDYTLGFDAYNSYLWLGAGPVLLANDTQNCYWLDISRDNGRLIRFMTDNNSVPTMAVLTTNSAIEMPHSGKRKYKISVEHDEAGITFTVDADNDGSVELTYTDDDPEALVKFATGKIGFHKDYPEKYHRISYDNIKVNVTQFSEPQASAQTSYPASPTFNPLAKLWNWIKGLLAKGTGNAI